VTAIAVGSQVRLTVALARKLHMILVPLFAEMRRVFGEIPDTYLVVDLETSGFEPERDYILQIGHCLVVDRQVVDRQAFLLDWTQVNDVRVDTGWLESRIEETGAQIRAQGKTFHTTWERLLTEGVEARSVLADYCSWINEIRARRMFFVMHNGAFDTAFFNHSFHRFLTPLLPGVDRCDHFTEHNVFDTGTILKAAQLPELPRAGETLRAFSRRVAGVRRKGVRWSLNEYAVPLFGLDKKYGLTAAQAHDAGYDAYVTHLLFEELRTRAERELRRSA
jgi:DNA polymerase III epsilon subunit-like protein